MKVLVVAQDALHGQVAGTSIRALELARQLAPHHDVTVAGVGDAPAQIAGLPCVGYHPQRPRTLRAPLAQADAILSLTQWPPLLHALRRSGARLVFDLYVPEALETLGGFPGSRAVLRRVFTQLAIDRVVDALHAGDQFLCASEKQRDLWLGVMLAERLIDPTRYDADPSLRSLIDVVPFGLPAEPPEARDDGIRAAFPAIGADDEVLLWNGGLWPWLDAETAIRAVSRLAARRPGIHLVFMGAARQVPAQRATQRARALAAELGLLDSVVHFNPTWVDYERRADWLLAANCAVSTHEDHLETRFAFRTRLLDCFWAGLPVACTAGDDLAELVRGEELGAVVAPGDEEALAAGIEQILDAGGDAFADSLQRVARRFAWPQVAAPVVRQLAGAPPPRVAGPYRRRPAHALRDRGYRTARSGLNAIGLHDWPRV
jgi:glycosyltransferase involved in cell wall biosynthesis